jgi:hypothetical protein
MCSAPHPSASATSSPTPFLLKPCSMSLPKSERLAAAYMERHIITPKFTDDARHVAVCTVTQIEYLVSWNFKHLVNVEREKGFNAVNLLQGYRPIRIVNPLELIYGNQAQSI